MRKPSNKIKFFEEFSVAGQDDGQITLTRLIDNEGCVVDKKGTSQEENGVADEEGSTAYMGGITHDGTIVGAYGGTLPEGSALAKKYPHLVLNCAMNDREELFDFAAGDKYKGQKQFNKIGKFTH